MRKNLYLNKLTQIPDFESYITDASFKQTLPDLDVMQINLGRLCNLSCKHCHMEAGPTRTETMSRGIMEACLKVYREQGFKVIDITGGAPEMNQHFEWFVEESVKVSDRVIVRTNLVILRDKKYRHLPQFYADRKIELTCSLPYYQAKDTNRQRGDGVFEKSIQVIKELNNLGYGENPDLILNFVYNPGGAFFPPQERAMEKEYKSKLSTEHGIVFNQLFTMMNNPVGRFASFLEKSGNLESYMGKLVRAYNCDTLEKMMCRNQLSVAWDGRLYDCDFNQATEIPIQTQQTIHDLIGKPAERRQIQFGKNCFACTAGQGSSCGGSIKATA